MFRYTVTKDDFTEMTVYLMKQKSAKTSSKVKLVLFTIVQMAVIAWLIIVGKDVSPVIRILMGVFSLLWAAQTIFSYGFYKVRAKMMLTNQADNDKSGDFWKEHRLQLQGDNVNITYGDKKASVECAQITGTQETENLLLLMSGNGIFELVPKTVAEKPDFQDFLAGIRKAAADKLKAAQEKQRADALENASFKEYLPLSEDEVVTELVRMKRQIGQDAFQPGVVARRVKDAVHSVADHLGVAAPIGRNHRQPRRKRADDRRTVVRKQVQPAGEGGYLLTVADGVINLFTREYQFRYKIAQLRKAMEGKDGTLFLFFPNQQMVFVPSSVSAEFKKAVNNRHSLSELSHMDIK